MEHKTKYILVGSVLTVMVLIGIGIAAATFYEGVGIDAGNTIISNVMMPINGHEAANKDYVDIEVAAAASSPVNWDCGFETLAGGVHCPVGRKLITGGCGPTLGSSIVSSYPIAGTGSRGGWQCQFSGPSFTGNAFAWCCG